MIKCLLPLLLAVLLLCACGQETPPAPPAPTSQPTQSTQPHTCTSVCPVCGFCGNAACTDALCAEKCPGAHKEEPQVFSREGFITDAPVSIDTGTFVFDVGENVYVPGNLTEISQTVAATMEQVSCLDFDGAGYARESFPDGKVHLRVSRDLLYVGQDWYQGLATSEVGGAFASAWQHAEMSPGDLFLGSGYAAVHELSHVLMFRQSEWSHCQLLNEGFAEYTAYLALLELEQTDPATASYLSKSFYPLANMMLTSAEYTELFRHPLEHWFENTLECGNSNYTIGFRFMAYLQAVYGDYSKWITAFENTYCFTEQHGDSNESTVAQQLQVLKDTYGPDVLDNFYPWLEANLHLFDDSACMTNTTDLTSVTQIGWYPIFNAVETVMKMEQVRYRDLYVDLEPAKQYLHEYKGLDISGLYLENPDNHTVICYQADGSCSTPTSDNQIPLEGISYIKLAGEGEVISLQLKGFGQE